MTEQEPLRPLSGSQMESLEEATASYEAAVTEVVARLLLDRGISKETASGFRLGEVRDPFPGHERFEGWLAIPYLDRDDRPLSMRFRCPSSHEHRDYGHGKYMSVFEEPARVFNVRAIHRAADTIHVCEGELDCITLNQIGLPAVAIPGATGWQRHHRRMLDGFNRVYVWGDPDDAGAEFNMRVTRAMSQAKAVRMRGGDVNDIYLSGGAEALLSLIPEEK